MHRIDQRVVVTRQCAVCAEPLLARGCPLKIVSWNELESDMRAYKPCGDSHFVSEQCDEYV